MLYSKDKNQSFSHTKRQWYNERQWNACILRTSTVLVLIHLCLFLKIAQGYLHRIKRTTWVPKTRSNALSKGTIPILLSFSVKKWWQQEDNLLHEKYCKNDIFSHIFGVSRKAWLAGCKSTPRVNLLQFFLKNMLVQSNAGCTKQKTAWVSKKAPYFPSSCLFASVRNCSRTCSIYDEKLKR